MGRKVERKETGREVEDGRNGRCKWEEEGEQQEREQGGEREDSLTMSKRDAAARCMAAETGRGSGGGRRERKERAERQEGSRHEVQAVLPIRPVHFPPKPAGGDCPACPTS